ncbi:MAG: T9SS type A sorting domain-containing protein [Bacteroidota bacterium]|nr:T9SS type A sorting domain-containing protein [Bacteroidota bacterium]
MKKLLLFVFALSLSGNAMSQSTYPDVAGIFFANCGSCHNDQGGHGSFLRYSGILPYTATMTAYLTSGYMPPWSPDTTYSRFSHERSITAADKNAILNWINDGALPGDTTLAPPIPTYSQYQLGGTPDLVLQIPTFASNANTTDAYNCFSIPSGLTQDRILRAFEIIAGDHEIVHHVVVNVDTLGTSSNDLSGTCYSIGGDFSIGAYAPGAAPTVFPSTGPMKMGITIKAGSKIVMQIHYPPGTFGSPDSTKIRMYFYPIGETGVRPVYVTTPLQNWSLNIPANTVQTFTAQYPTGSGGLGADISAFAIFPHAHHLATVMENYAFFGTDTVPLIRINNWNFNWQGFYTFRNMPKIPGTHKLFSRHIYDNTASNPQNPSSPPINVYAGLGSYDEMLFDGLQFLNYQAGDELVNLDSMFAFDPLVNSIPSNFKGNNFSSLAFPNPFIDQVNFEYTLTTPSKVNIDIYTMQGVKVKSIATGLEQAGTHKIRWDGNGETGSLASGTYVYIIRAGEMKSYGRLSLISVKH